jgi:hypothetical protein
MDNKTTQQQDRLLQALRDWLLEAWLESIEWDMSALLEAVDRGIPEDWAAAIEEQSAGKVPKKLWPHLIRSPRIIARQGKTAQAGTGTGPAMFRRKRRDVGEAQAVLKQQRVSISMLARELKEPRSTVNSWFRSGALNRAIPGKYARLLRERYGIPESSWQKVLQES